MINFNIKPQNRDRIGIILLLAAFKGVIDGAIFDGLIYFLISTGLNFIAVVMLGNVTRFVLNKLGFDLNPKTTDDTILDSEEKTSNKEAIENQKDLEALNYGIGWIILFTILAIL